MAINRKLLLNIAYLNNKSISELAARNDIPQSNLSKWFNGKKGGYVKEEKIDRMAKSLGVDYKTGKFLPKIHRWIISDYEEERPLIFTLNSLSPGGGELILIKVNLYPCKDNKRNFEGNSIAAEEEPGWRKYAVFPDSKEYIVIIPYDHSFRLIVDMFAPYFLIEKELKETKSFWKFKKNKEGQITSLTFEAAEKGITDRFETNSLSIEELDRILGVEESQWTWDRLVSSLREQGKVPEEVARREGLETA